jgi:hypothetical protein
MSTPRTNTPHPDEKKLALARNQIRAILEQHDLAGIVFAATATHTSYLTRLDPSWSCATTEHSPNGQVALRMRPGKQHYGGDQAKCDQALAATAGMLSGFLDLLRPQTEHITQVLRTLAKFADLTTITRRLPPRRFTYPET